MSPIFTNHARDRIKERKFEFGLAEQTFRNPDKTRDGKQSGTTEFIKKFGNETVTLIGKKNEHNEWVIISAWIDPPRAGTADFRKKENWKQYQKSGFWGKLLYVLRGQLGL